MKFLIIRFSSVGEIVLSTPVVRCLKKQLADAEVHFLTMQKFAGIVESNPYIDRVHLLAHSWELMIEEIRQEDYDIIIDLQNDTRASRLKKELRVKSFTFNKLNIQKWIFTNLKWNLMPDLHLADRFLKTLETFGIRNDGEGLDFFIPQKNEVNQKDIPVSHQAGYFGLIINAKNITQKIPTKSLKEFCKRINHPVILLGGEEDAETGRDISSVDPVKIYNSCGKFNLNETADLIRRSKLIITHDTGLMHIAAAFRKPIISIWGNTLPEFGLYPYFGHKEVGNKILQVSKLRCRPCSAKGNKKCPKGHFKCMNQISIESIINEAEIYF